MYSPPSLDLDVPPNTPVDQDELADSTYDNSFPPIETMTKYLVSSGRHASLPPITAVPACIDPCLINGPNGHCDEDDIDKDDIAMWDDDDYSDDSMYSSSSDEPLNKNYALRRKLIPAFQYEMPDRHRQLATPPCSPHANPHEPTSYILLANHHMLGPFEYAIGMISSQYPRGWMDAPMMTINVDGVDVVCCDMLGTCSDQEWAIHLSDTPAAIVYSFFACTFTHEVVYQPKDSPHPSICRYHLAMLRHIRASILHGIALLQSLLKTPLWTYTINSRPAHDPF
jgi:hypothetical protein